MERNSAGWNGIHAVERNKGVERDRIELNNVPQGDGMSGEVESGTVHTQEQSGTER